ncbi:Uncharacterised protein [Bordetella pertussis]|nr:Uncharacterised protein [Bordetella pertussis]
MASVAGKREAVACAGSAAAGTASPWMRASSRLMA